MQTKQIFQEYVILEQLHWQYSMEKLIVDGHPNLYRDCNSGAIVNNNSVEFNNYMKSYKTRQQNSARIDTIENDLQGLKFEIDEIKQLLITLNSKL